MHIEPIRHPELLELQLAGRLDADWAATVQKAIDDGVRAGYHAVVLDLAAVDYISSAGIAVLVKTQREFQKLGGFFGAGGVAGPAQEVIQLSGLGKVLLCDLVEVRGRFKRRQIQAGAPAQTWSSDGARFESHALTGGQTLKWELIGQPDAIRQSAIGPHSASAIAFGKRTAGLGLAALGQNQGDGECRLGEFLAVDGSAIAMPASGTRKPDYQLSHGDFVPTIQMGYGVRWQESYQHRLRFEVDDTDSPLGLAAVVENAMTASGASAIGLVMIAETAGLVGASLRKSPALAPATGTRFQHPEIRDWLTFSPEKSFSGSLTVIVGLAMKGGGESRLASFVRPLKSDGGTAGHFHAAAFSYQPLRKQEQDLSNVVSNLFEHSQLQGLLHLINDERPIAGLGESEFRRGVIWIGPLEPATGGQS